MTITKKKKKKKRKKRKEKLKQTGGIDRYGKKMPLCGGEIVYMRGGKWVCAPREYYLSTSSSAISIRTK